ncbi:MAG TPA: hypothetical protein VFE58_02170 [Tepidisphaeraceae bacterium]|jgi:hypothetical protein|nr:hypothetical protein [Tepidisphaeraceae bacterium]
MNKKPLNPKLPGRYGKMTARELDEVADALDRPIAASETRSLTAGERAQWQRAKRGPGRPARGKGAKVISLTVEQSLLAKADQAARKAGISRAALFEMGLVAILGKETTRKAG